MYLYLNKLCDFISLHNNNYELIYLNENNIIYGNLFFKNRMIFSFRYSNINNNYYDDTFLDEYNVESFFSKINNNDFEKFLKDKILKIIGFEKFLFI